MYSESDGLMLQPARQMRAPGALAALAPSRVAQVPVPHILQMLPPKPYIPPHFAQGGQVEAHRDGFDPEDLSDDQLQDVLNYLASKGQGNDDRIVHINPREAQILKQIGGSGTINPETGLQQFDDGDGGDGGDGAGDGSGDGAGAGSDGSSGDAGASDGSSGSGSADGSSGSGDAGSSGDGASGAGSSGDGGSGGSSGDGSSGSSGDGAGDAGASDGVGGFGGSNDAGSSNDSSSNDSSVSEDSTNSSSTNDAATNDSSQADVGAFADFASSAQSNSQNSSNPDTQDNQSNVNFNSTNDVSNVVFDDQLDPNMQFSQDPQTFDPQVIAELQAQSQQIDPQDPNSQFQDKDITTWLDTPQQEPTTPDIGTQSNGPAPAGGPTGQGISDAALAGLSAATGPAAAGTFGLSGPVGVDSSNPGDVIAGQTAMAAGQTDAPAAVAGDFATANASAPAGTSGSSNASGNTGSATASASSGSSSASAGGAGSSGSAAESGNPSGSASGSGSVGSAAGSANGTAAANSDNTQTADNTTANTNDPAAATSDNNAAVTAENTGAPGNSSEISGSQPSVPSVALSSPTAQSSPSNTPAAVPSTVTSATSANPATGQTASNSNNTVASALNAVLNALGPSSAQAAEAPAHPVSSPASLSMASRSGTGFAALTTNTPSQQPSQAPAPHPVNVQPGQPITIRQGASYKATVTLPANMMPFGITPPASAIAGYMNTKGFSNATAAPVPGKPGTYQISGTWTSPTQQMDPLPGLSNVMESMPAQAARATQPAQAPQQQPPVSQAPAKAPAPPSRAPSAPSDDHASADIKSEVGTIGAPGLVGMPSPQAQAQVVATSPVPTSNPYGGAYAGATQSYTAQNAQAIRDAATRLGVSPSDLATVMAYETKGTFSPSIMGGKGGNYQGLIQFGPQERGQFGVTGNQTVAQQLNSVVAYLAARGVSPQRNSLSDIYRAVNGGNVDANLNRTDGNGTIADKIDEMSTPSHWAAQAANQMMGLQQDATPYATYAPQGLASPALPTDWQTAVPSQNIQAVANHAVQQDHLFDSRVQAAARAGANQHSTRGPAAPTVPVSRSNLAPPPTGKSTGPRGDLPDILSPTMGHAVTGGPSAPIGTVTGTSLAAPGPVGPANTNVSQYAQLDYAPPAPAGTSPSAFAQQDFVPTAAPQPNVPTSFNTAQLVGLRSAIPGLPAPPAAPPPAVGPNGAPAWAGDLSTAHFGPAIAQTPGSEYNSGPNVTAPGQTQVAAQSGAHVGATGPGSPAPQGAPTFTSPPSGTYVGHDGKGNAVAISNTTGVPVGYMVDKDGNTVSAPGPAQTASKGTSAKGEKSAKGEPDKAQQQAKAQPSKPMQDKVAHAITATAANIGMTAIPVVGPFLGVGNAVLGLTGHQTIGDYLTQSAQAGTPHEGYGNSGEGYLPPPLHVASASLPPATTPDPSGGTTSIPLPNTVPGRGGRVYLGAPANPYGYGFGPAQNFYLYNDLPQPVRAARGGFITGRQSGGLSALCRTEEPRQSRS